MMPGGPSPDDILATCEVFRQKTSINVRDDASFADWGFRLFQVAIMHEDQNKKANLLKESIEKLDKAIKINSCAKGEDGAYAQHVMAHAWFFSFMLEKDDTTAEAHLNKMKRAIRQGMIVDSTNGEMEQLEASLGTVYEQRKQAQEQLARLEGKSEEEKRAELMKMSIDMHNQALMQKRQEVAMAGPVQRKPLLIELAGILLECALLQTKRKEGISLLKEAADAGKEATDPREPELYLRSLFLQTLIYSALSYAELDRGAVATHQKASQECFEKLCSSPEGQGARAELEGQRMQMVERYKGWKAQMLDPTDGGKPTGKAPEPSTASRGAAAPPSTAPAGPGAGAGGGSAGGGGGGGKEENDVLGFVVLAGGLLVVGGLVWLYSRRKE